MAFANGDVDAAFTAELYDPATGRWRLTDSLHEGRYAHPAVLLSDGRVMVVGGTRGGWWLHNSAEGFDPATERWTLLAAMDVGRSGHTATALADGRVLVAGGIGLSSWAPYEWQDTAELFSPIGPPPRAFLPTTMRLAPGESP